MLSILTTASLVTVAPVIEMISASIMAASPVFESINFAEGAPMYLAYGPSARA